jgi:hypothetical protein
MKKIFTLLLFLVLSLSAFSTSVTFQVSMKGSGITYDSVFVVGDKTNWEFVQLADQGDSLFSATMNIPADDSVVFYFITIGYWASDYLDYREIVPVDCDGSAELYGWDGDRAFIIPSDAVTYAYYWGTCDEVEQGTAIPEHADFSDFEMFPNPATGQITILLNEGMDKPIMEILDISGKIVKNMELSGRKTTLDISDLPQGLYMARIQSTTTTLVKKLIVQ